MEALTIIWVLIAVGLMLLFVWQLRLKNSSTQQPPEKAKTVDELCERIQACTEEKWDTSVKKAALEAYNKKWEMLNATEKQALAEALASARFMITEKALL